MSTYEKDPNLVEVWEVERPDMARCVSTHDTCHLFIDEAGGAGLSPFLTELYEEDLAAAVRNLFAGDETMAEEEDSQRFVWVALSNNEEGRFCVPDRVVTLRLEKVFRNQPNISNYWRGRRRSHGGGNSAVYTVLFGEEYYRIGAIIDAAKLAEPRVASVLWIIVDERRCSRTAASLMGYDCVRSVFPGGIWSYPEEVGENANCGKRIHIAPFSAIDGFEAEAVVADHSTLLDNHVLACSRATTTLVHVMQLHDAPYEKFGVKFALWTYSYRRAAIWLSLSDYRELTSFSADNHWSRVRGLDNGEWDELKRRILVRNGLDEA